MQIPDSIIDPCAAATGAKYVIAFKDDDWDCWSTLDEASTYLGWRQGDRWFFGALEGGTTGDWNYADDEVVVLAEAPTGS